MTETYLVILSEAKNLLQTLPKRFFVAFASQNDIVAFFRIVSIFSVGATFTVALVPMRNPFPGRPQGSPLQHHLSLTVGRDPCVPPQNAPICTRFPVIPSEARNLPHPAPKRFFGLRPQNDMEVGAYREIRIPQSAFG